MLYFDSLFCFTHRQACTFSRYAENVPPPLLNISITHRPKIQYEETGQTQSPGGLLRWAALFHKSSSESICHHRHPTGKGLEPGLHCRQLPETSKNTPQQRGLLTWAGNVSIHFIYSFIYLIQLLSHLPSLERTPRWVTCRPHNLDNHLNIKHS